MITQRQKETQPIPHLLVAATRNVILPHSIVFEGVQASPTYSKIRSGETVAARASMEAFRSPNERSPAPQKRATGLKSGENAQKGPQ
jgi:hypothetical protein